MVTTAADRETAQEVELAELRARVAALERLLERRSLELRALADGFCTIDLQRALDGYLPPSPSLRQLGAWQETHAMRRADIEEALSDLWRAAIVDGAGERDA